MGKLLTIFLSLVSINAFATVWDLQGKVLKLSSIIPPNTTIKNAILEANPYIQIFDTTTILLNCKTKEFSTAWYGCKPANQDNSVEFQKSINTCVSNGIKNLFVASSFSFGKLITVYNLVGNTYIGVDINIYGDGGFWSDYTTLTFTGTAYWAIGFQVAKGGSIHNLKIKGQFVSPANNGVGYYSLTQDQFNDASGRCLANNYVGLAIDYDMGKNIGGSTGFRVYDMWIDGFDCCYSVARQWGTFNGDILIFDNIRVGNCRIGFRSTQAQEKGNEINNIVSWDNVHTLISIGSELRAQAGNYSINGGNIAGGCIRLFNIAQKGWFPSHIYNLYAENFGQIGTITTGDSQNTLPISINGCVFDFAYPSQAGNRTLLSSNSCFIKFNSCIFRYYGSPSDSLKFDGKATFDNCFFSGKVVGSTGCFVNYPLPVQQLITQL